MGGRTTSPALARARRGRIRGTSASRDGPTRWRRLTTRTTRYSSTPSWRCPTDEDEGDAEPKVRGDAEPKVRGDAEPKAGGVSDDEDEVTAPASRRYALDPALALGPRLLAPRMDGVLRFRETLDPTALDDVDAGEGADAGAWYAFENGVAFVSASAPPLALVVGVNVVAVDVHEGIRDPDDEPAARGRGRRGRARRLPNGEKRPGDEIRREC